MSGKASNVWPAVMGLIGVIVGSIVTAVVGLRAQDLSAEAAVQQLEWRTRTAEFTATREAIVTYFEALMLFVDSLDREDATRSLQLGEEARQKGFRVVLLAHPQLSGTTIDMNTALRDMTICLSEGERCPDPGAFANMVSLWLTRAKQQIWAERERIEAGPTEADTVTVIDWSRWDYKRNRARSDE